MQIAREDWPLGSTGQLPYETGIAIGYAGSKAGLQRQRGLNGFHACCVPLLYEGPIPQRRFLAPERRFWPLFLVPERRF